MLCILVKPGQMDIKAKRNIWNRTEWTQIHRTQKQTTTISLQALEDDVPTKDSNPDEDKVGNMSVLVVKLIKTVFKVY